MSLDVTSHYEIHRWSWTDRSVRNNWRGWSDSSIISGLFLLLRACCRPENNSASPFKKTLHSLERHLLQLRIIPSYAVCSSESVDEVLIELWCDPAVMFWNPISRGSGSSRGRCAGFARDHIIRLTQCRRVSRSPVDNKQSECNYLHQFCGLTALWCNTPRQWTVLLTNINRHYSIPFPTSRA